MSIDAVSPSGVESKIHWHDKTIVIRPIRADDEGAFVAFVGQLAPEDLRMRFFSYPHQLTHDELVRLTDVDEARELALVAVRTTDGCDEILGVARAVTESDGINAELGIIVRSDLKSEGLGWLLLRHLIAGVAGRGLRRLVAYVLRENLAMLDLARSNGFVTDRAGCDDQALRLVLELDPKALPDRTCPTTMPGATA